MKKFVCSVCGYVYEGEQAPEFCPQCKAPREKFIEKKEGASFACEHEIGVAQGVDKEVYDGLVMNFNGECTEVGMYLAMRPSGRARRLSGGCGSVQEICIRRGRACCEVRRAARRSSYQQHKKNVEMRAEAEAGACEGKLQIAKRAKELGYDAIHDTVHEMAKDEARHGAGFNGLLKRYFAD